VTDNNYALRKMCTGVKDGLNSKSLHFAAQILRVDIQTKVLYFQEITKSSGRGKKTSEHSDGLLAQNLEAVLAGVVILSGSIFCICLSGVETHSKTLTREIHGGLKSILSEDPRIMNSYQAI